MQKVADEVRRDIKVMVRLSRWEWGRIRTCARDIPHGTYLRLAGLEKVTSTCGTAAPPTAEPASLASIVAPAAGRRRAAEANAARAKQAAEVPKKKGKR